MRNNKGSALAEMAILSSVYVIIATAAVYMGNIALIKIGAQMVAGIAATQPGAQMLADVEDQVPKFRVVTITDFSDTIDEEEMFDSDDINAALEELGRAPVGYYKYEDGEIIYVLDEDRMSAFGRYIFDNDIQAESDEVAEITAGWAYRTEATISCTYEPVFGEWDPINIAGISSSSSVSGEQDRGTHPPDEPDFNKDISDMLHDDPFPAPLDNEPELWMGQELP
ncbi:hypothetical protein ACFL01_02430 [Planctomycetota bacterium]